MLSASSHDIGWSLKCYNIFFVVVVVNWQLGCFKTPHERYMIVLKCKYKMWCE